MRVFAEAGRGFMGLMEGGVPQGNEGDIKDVRGTSITWGITKWGGVGETEKDISVQSAKGGRKTGKEEGGV